MAVAAQRSRCADLESTRICCFSAANDFTTLVPLMFSSTIPATSAIRACVIHDSGNTVRRKRIPK